MSSSCEFKFDRANAIFYSGEIVTGRIVLKTSSIKSVNRIYILFLGLAKVIFEEQRSDTTSGNEVRYERVTSHATEMYVKSHTNVYEKGRLPDGTHTFPFSIPLPLECPTSCVGKYGKISYELSLVMERFLRYNNVFIRPLTVLQTYNLNLHPEMSMPIEHEAIRKLCCWPFRSGPINLHLAIPFSGYAAGQTINYKVHIDNMSNRDVKGFSMTLIQIYEFRIRHERRIVSSYYRGEFEPEVVAPEHKRTIKGHYIIPSLPPTSLAKLIIQVSYMIRLTVLFSGWHMKWNIDVPITIGTIPLTQSGDRNAPKEYIPDIKDIQRHTVGDPPPSYNEHQPLFEHSAFIGKLFVDPDANEYNRTDDFLPMYPVYRNMPLTKPTIEGSQTEMAASEAAPSEVTPEASPEASSEASPEASSEVTPDTAPKTPPKE
ncbi:arrestin domain-containing protein 2-like [Drosophila montana]|uniref:arrestin domain-containing protein 2-like n=1 Tax=Drosophila montana TaxID=40370 RepID=UPI00313F32A2